ncbi:hypothetical protein TNCV_868041 [Trichonephila clavipes]|nr:hypothetical protein TNCV_868041 [Trichonephila clavipes]
MKKKLLFPETLRHWLTGLGASTTTAALPRSPLSLNKILILIISTVKPYFRSDSGEVDMQMIKNKDKIIIDLFIQYLMRPTRVAIQASIRQGTLSGILHPIWVTLTVLIGLNPDSVFLVLYFHISVGIGKCQLETYLARDEVSDWLDARRRQPWCGCSFSVRTSISVT